MTVELKETVESSPAITFDTNDEQRTVVLDALPSILAAIQNLHVISGPEIIFHRKPIECITFGFYIRGHHPDVGRTSNGLTGDETFVRYSVFPTY